YCLRARHRQRRENISSLLEASMKLCRILNLKLTAILALGGMIDGTLALAQSTQPNARHHHYKVIDVGTFGGSNGDVLLPPPAAQILSNTGIFVGTAETRLPDPFPFACFDDECLVKQPLIELGDVRIHLNSLRRGYSGGPISVNDLGVA